MRSLHDEAKASPIPPQSPRPTLQEAATAFAKADAEAKYRLQRSDLASAEATQAYCAWEQAAEAANHARAVLDAVILGEPLPPRGRKADAMARLDVIAQERSAEVKARLERFGLVDTSRPSDGKPHYREFHPVTGALLYASSGEQALNDAARDLDDDGA